MEARTKTTQMQFTLTREQLEAKRVALKEEEGLELTGDHGVIRQMGVTVEYGFEEPVLTVTIIEAPPFLHSLAESRIHEWFGEPD